MLRALTQRTRLSFEPALSFVPEPRAPPKGCCHHHRARRLVVDVEIAGGVAERQCCVAYGLAIPAEHRAR